jgi:hypothetical protein
MSTELVLTSEVSVHAKARVHRRRQHVEEWRDGEGERFVRVCPGCLRPLKWRTYLDARDGLVETPWCSGHRKTSWWKIVDRKLGLVIGWGRIRPGRAGVIFAKPQQLPRLLARKRTLRKLWRRPNLGNIRYVKRVDQRGQGLLPIIEGEEA